MTSRLTLLTIFLFTINVHAQDLDTVTIYGRVMDQNSAILPGAEGECTRKRRGRPGKHNVKGVLGPSSPPFGGLAPSGVEGLWNPGNDPSPDLNRPSPAALFSGAVTCDFSTAGSSSTVHREACPRN